MQKIDPLLVDVNTACALLGVKRTTLFAKLRDQVLIRRKIGRKTLVTMHSIKALAEQGDA